MAEIKTFRCDVCGDTFHSDDKVNTEFVIHTRTNEDIKTYDHICPGCSRNFNRLLKKPCIFEEMRCEKGKYKKHALNLEYMIKTLGQKVFDYNIWTHSGLYDVDTACYNSLCDEIAAEYNKTKKSCNRWSAVASLLFGIVISLIFWSIF